MRDSVARHAWAALVALAGCHWAAGGYGPRGTGGGVAIAECHEVRRTAAKRPAPPPPADPAFARLLAFRPYYSLDRVGAYEHHFAVWFSCVEQSVDFYAVAPDGTVRREGGAWGGLAVGGSKAPVPAAQAANARRVAAQHAADYVDASVGKVTYLGWYREVQVTERLPVSPPGDPYARLMWHATVTLRADAGLTRFDGKLASMHGGETRMCWRDLAYVPCDAPRWIDVDTPPSAAPDLVALVRDDSPLPAAERGRFTAAVLAAARDREAGRPGASVDAILARQGDGVLPPHLAPPLRTAFTIRVGRAGAPVSLLVPLAPADALHGTSRSTARTTVAGVPVAAEVEASAVTPLAADARGAHQVQLHVRYRLTAGAGPGAVVRDADAVVDVDALVGADAAVITHLAWPAEATSHPALPPLAQTLPVGGVTLDARFGVSVDVEPWWGPSSGG